MSTCVVFNLDQSSDSVKKSLIMYCATWRGKRVLLVESVGLITASTSRRNKPHAINERAAVGSSRYVEVLMDMINYCTVATQRFDLTHVTRQISDFDKLSSLPNRPVFRVLHIVRGVT